MAWIEEDKFGINGVRPIHHIARSPLKRIGKKPSMMMLLYQISYTRKGLLKHVYSDRRNMPFVNTVRHGVGELGVPPIFL